MKFSLVSFWHYRALSLSHSTVFWIGAGESIVPPMAMEQILTAMAASVLHSASGMSSWGMADLTLGLYKVWNRHTLEKAVDTIKGVPVGNV